MSVLLLKMKWTPFYFVGFALHFVIINKFIILLEWFVWVPLALGETVQSLIGK